MEQACRNSDRRIPALPKSLGGLVTHGDRLTGMDDLDGKLLDFSEFEFPAETVLGSHQQNLRVARTRGSYGAFDFRLGRRVGTHGINSNTSHGDQFK
jgi:hypothetical protein